MAVHSYITKLIDMANKKLWESIFPKQKLNTMKKAQADANAAKPTTIGMDLGAEDDVGFVSLTKSNNYVTFSNFLGNCYCPRCQPNFYTASQLQSYQQIYNGSQFLKSQQQVATMQQQAYNNATNQLSNQYYAQLVNLYNNQIWPKQMPIGMLFAGSEVINFEPDPNYPDTMGWRCWNWYVDEKKLLSPVRDTIWNDAELRCEIYDETDVIRGVAGIHARIVPIEWEKQFCPEGLGGAFLNVGRYGNYIQIDGLVERFGRYVLGEVGWRTEWAVIRKLKAPNTEIGLELEKKFPDVEVIYE